MVISKQVNQSPKTKFLVLASHENLSLVELKDVISFATGYHFYQHWKMMVHQSKEMFVRCLASRLKRLN